MREKPAKDTVSPPIGEAQEGDRDISARRSFDDLPPAAQRALKEAEERRRSRPDEGEQPTEIGGRGGKNPTRYGDWEIDGRAVDF
ncbi:MAG: DUF1674 domain-containing protein [Hyphomicrobiales bacterium]|nr:DUF1674 domain-containing protein [Hyphomicrobiales bacterium]MCP5001417.1 DUF1674 domain-containing protein [Hyphomicrobiales bacterium]